MTPIEIAYYVGDPKQEVDAWLHTFRKGELKLADLERLVVGDARHADKLLDDTQSNAEFRVLTRVMEYRAAVLEGVRRRIR